MPSVKADLAIYSYVVTVSGYCLSVATIKRGVIVTIQSVFANLVTNSVRHALI